MLHGTKNLLRIIFALFVNLAHCLQLAWTLVVQAYVHLCALINIPEDSNLIHSCMYANAVLISSP